MGHPDGKRTPGQRCRDVGVEAARRLKDILRSGSVPPRPLPPMPAPPSFGEERRPPRLGLRFAGRSRDDDAED